MNRSAHFVRTSHCNHSLYHICGSSLPWLCAQNSRFISSLLARCHLLRTEHPALHPLPFPLFQVSKGCSHPEIPALIHENPGVTGILIQNLSQVMSPTGSSTTRSLLNRRILPGLKTGSCQNFVLQPVIVVFYSRFYWKHCYALRSRLGPRTNSCSAGSTTVLTRAGTIASVSLWKRRLDVQFISMSELQRLVSHRGRLSQDAFSGREQPVDVSGSNESIFRNSAPRMLRNLFLKAIGIICSVRQDLNLWSKNTKLDLLTIVLVSFSNKLMLNDSKLEETHHGYVESRREQVSTTRRISCERKSSPRCSDPKYARDGRNEESSRATGRRILFAETERKSWNHTEAHFTSTRVARKNELIIWVTQEKFTKWRVELVWKNHTFPVNQQEFQVHALCWASTNACNLTHGIDLDYRKTFFANPRSTLESLQKPYRGIHPFMTPNAAGEAPAIISTGALVAREEERIGNTIPMPTFACRPSNMRSLSPVDIPQSSMFGQQRQRISELQFDKFLLHPHFCIGR